MLFASPVLVIVPSSSLLLSCQSNSWSSQGFVWVDASSNLWIPLLLLRPRGWLRPMVQEEAYRIGREALVIGDLIVRGAD
jgi:hypothetical protein